MILRLDPGSPAPPYAQVRDQIATMVRSGVLAPGTRLPAIRHLAADLGVAPGTAARAYRELEADGLVETRGRHGTRVLAPRPVPAPAGEVDAELDRAASSFALAVAHRGQGVDQALDAVRAAFRRLDDQRGTT